MPSIVNEQDLAKVPKVSKAPRVQWNPAGYHRVATVQQAWGLRVLDTLPAKPFRRILDAECGSGRLTLALLRRYPNAKIVGLDQSAAMLHLARRNLCRFRRVDFLAGDLLTAEPGDRFDLIFSNATFHWVLDHPTLFRNLYSTTCDSIFGRSNRSDGGISHAGDGANRLQERSPIGVYG